jgi:hypothetical protein
LNARIRLTFPPDVSLKRFAALRLVFIFGIFASLYGPPPGYFFGAITIVMVRPSIAG